MFAVVCLKSSLFITESKFGQMKVDQLTNLSFWFESLLPANRKLRRPTSLNWWAHVATAGWFWSNCYSQMFAPCQANNVRHTLAHPRRPESSHAHLAEYRLNWSIPKSWGVCQLVVYWDISFAPLKAPPGFDSAASNIRCTFLSSRLSWVFKSLN